MKKATRIALGTAGLAIGLALAGAAPASAQVGFYGSFPVPFGRITVGVPAPPVPAPVFAVGAAVPPGYVVVNDPYYGYGFVYGGQWIACQPYGSTWVVVSRRPYYGHYGYGSHYAYGGHPGYYGQTYAHGQQAWHGADRYASRSFERDHASRSYNRQANQRVTGQGRASSENERRWNR
jgi:hypothetical protein